jgi:serine phosphatase RsbU (regulator of sigma subunit)/ligand-binding sensor domain-containing protein
MENEPSLILYAEERVYLKMTLRCVLLTYLLLSLFVVSSTFAQDSTPTNTISIEGTLLMLDDKTPHVAVVVQAIRGGKPVATVLSDEGGKYQLINLKPGTYQVRCYTLNGYLYYGKDRPTDASHAASLQVRSGSTLKDVDFRFAPFKKGTWKTYTYLDGLGDNHISDIYRDPDGVMWFGTTGGVSRYDGKEFVNLTTKDGLAHNYVFTIHRDPDGVMWFGTYGGGVSRYDGREFVNFTTEDGLAHHMIMCIHQDPDGVMWFGGGLLSEGGVSRYDGKEFVNLTTEDGLAANNVHAIHRDPDGVMWFATWFGGVSRYDGKEWVNLTTEDGLAGDTVHAMHRDADGVMWFGTVGGGVSRYDGEEFVNFSTKDGLANDIILCIHQDPDGVMWFGASEWITEDGGLSRYDGRGFVNFTTKDGLANDRVRAIHRGPDGVMWFGTIDGGISRYDEKGFVNFTTKDGLAHRRVHAIHRGPDGVMWFGTDRGVSRYDGKEFVSLTTGDGLAGNIVQAIHRDPDGVMWFGTRSGVSRYDGEEFVNLTTKDGLAHNLIQCIYQDPDGVMWFGASDPVVEDGGLSRYDGKEFVNFTTEDGLVDNAVNAIHRDPDGVMWFVTWLGGVSRYDGKEFVNFTTEDGLVDNAVIAIHRDADGVMWFGTDGGVSRYDGEEFVNFSTEDGLAHNTVNAIHRDPDGVIWFGTEGGVSAYDGKAWTSLDTRDGLAGDRIGSILQDSDGFLWFGTDGGITRYRRSASPPKVGIVSVTTDQTYRLKTQDSRCKTEEPSIPAFTTGTRVTIEYSSIDFKTIPEKRQYRCRVYETGDLRHETSDRRLETSRRGDLDSTVSSLKSEVHAYNRPTRETSFDWTPRKPGRYTFEVQAIDRDLNYSQPASLTLKVVPPLYLRAVFLVPTVGSGTILLAALVIVTTALTKRRRQVHAYQQAAVRELQDAREMQMSLLPEVAPPVEGMEIAGRSIPANTVGGDFFDYLALADGKIGIAVADVSGKGLRAAMNATMTNGMMHEVATIEASCGRILSRLNTHLHPLMEKQMFTALSFAIIEQDSGVIQWSNAAQPLPLVKRSGGVSEAAEHGELPLGMAPDVKYPDHELKLQPGDVVIFYTDGIIEAENGAEEMYGTERLLNLATGMDSAASAEDVTEAILQDVADFVGAAEQYDDMTVVVVKRNQGEGKRGQGEGEKVGK